jgi:hypothetical protein
LGGAPVSEHLPKRPPGHRTRPAVMATDSPGTSPEYAPPGRLRRPIARSGVTTWMPRRCDTSLVVRRSSWGLWCKSRDPIGYLGYSGGCTVCESAMSKLKRVATLFKGRHFDRDVIILGVRGYLRFKLSLRDLVERMAERGLSMAIRPSWVGCSATHRSSRNAGDDLPELWAIHGGSTRHT